ncbi:MAG: SHD1 domain-containing protein [Pirellulaceae bacterium]
MTSRIGREGGPQPHFDSGSLSTLPLKLPKMEIRKFTLQANSGEPAKTVEAEVVGFAGQLVRLQKGDGRVAGVEISTLSSEDQSWIEQHFGAYRRILSGL